MIYEIWFMNRINIDTKTYSKKLKKAQQHLSRKVKDTNKGVNKRNT